MNDRDQIINDFLLFFRDIAEQNPGYEFNHSNVYNELIRLGVPAKEKEESVEPFFAKWINHFKKSSTCAVFVDYNWRYFCQFISRDQVAKNANEHLKIYVPLDSKHIKRGAAKIFEFLSKNGISHQSKIGKAVRFDDIVIRLVNPNDVKKVIEFLNNNNYIQEGLLPANPFAFNYNGIAMAVDGALSYNSTIASLISLYINDKSKQEKLDTVGVDDFYNFIECYYKNAFSSSTGLTMLEDDFSKASSTRYAVNYKNVFELILKSRKKDFSFEDYVSHFQKCSNKEIQKRKIEQIENIKSGHVLSITDDNNSTVEQQLSNEEIDTMLLRLIKGMIEKTNDQYTALKQIDCYLMTGDERYITRDNNLRNIISNSNFRNQLVRILMEKDISFIDYAQESLRTKLDNQKELVSNEYNDDKKEEFIISTVQQTLQIMTSKYGRRTAIDNLEKYIKTGDPSFLTRDFGLRGSVSNSSFRLDINNELNRNSIRLNDYLNYVLNVTVGSGEIYLQHAIIETYDKYEKKYQDGMSVMDGKTFVTAAVAKFIESGEYNGFTRDNKARKVLEENVSRDEATTIIKTKSEFDENNQIANGISEYVSKYVEIVLENNQRIK